MAQRRYTAFLSYRHDDNAQEGRRWAEWLHRALEQYVVPPDLAGTKNLRGEPVSASLYPVFRDEDELPANADLATGIRAALEVSDFLIVLCSPRSAVSPWVRKEVREFKELGRASRILAVIIAGEPNADDPSKARHGITRDEECFCEELRFGMVQAGGALDWSARTEPLAADLRPSGARAEGFVTAEAYRAHLTLVSSHPPEKIARLADAYREVLDRGLLKVIAGLLGVSLDDLIKRDAAHRAALAQRELARAEAEASRLRALNRRLVAAATVALLLFAIAGWFWWRAAVEKRRAEVAVREAVQLRRDRAFSRVAALLTAAPQAVPPILDTLYFYRAEILPYLRELRERPDLPEHDRVRVSLALAQMGESPADYLFSEMLRTTTDPEEMCLIRSALKPQAAGLRAACWKAVRDANSDADRRFRALVALAVLDPESGNWGIVSDVIVNRFLASNALQLKTWVDALRPVRSAFLEPLQRTFRTSESEKLRDVAATVLSDYAGGRPDILAELVLAATPAQFETLLPQIQAQKVAMTAAMQRALASRAPAGACDADLDRVSQNQANASLCLLHLGLADVVWPMLRFSDQPRVRTELIHGFHAFGVPPQTLVDRLAAEPDASARRALLLGLGEYRFDSLKPDDARVALGMVRRAFGDDPDPGIHSAAQWALRQWGQEMRQERPEATGSESAAIRFGWKRDSMGITFVQIPGPIEFEMGSPESEPDHEENEQQRRVRIPRSFAMATTETTAAQYKLFLAATQSHDKAPRRHSWDGPDSPMISVNWLDAMRFCRWLSEQAGVPKAEMCYPPLDQLVEGARLPADYLSRAGYRLPTDAEWEYACRAGTTSSRFYGSSEAMLRNYAWYIHNSDDHTWPVASLKPNDFGLFDMYGNAWEWCQNHQLGPGKREVIEDTDTVCAAAPQTLILRGGAFGSHARNIRSARMYPFDVTYLSVGLRIAKTCR